MAGCAGKTEEEIKAELDDEVRAELKAEVELRETLKEEIKEEMASEKNGNEEVDEVDLDYVQSKQEMNADFEDWVSYQGVLTCDIAPYQVLIEDYGQQTLALEKNEILKYIDRSNFTYHLEGFPMVDPIEPIYVTIQYDPATTYEAMGYLFVENYRVIQTSNDIDEQLKDYSNEAYPLTYYQDVIKTLCMGMYGSDQTVLENRAYQENEDFREAVDTILVAGYQLVKSNGYYKIANENAINIGHIPTVDEICRILGITLADINTREEGGYYLYISDYHNDEISIYIYHDEALKGSDRVSGISIKGYDFKLHNIALGETLGKAYSETDEAFDGFYNHHDDETMKYVFNVDGFALTFNDIGWDNTLQIDEDDLVRKINYYSVED